jgi:N-acetylneuraminate synthase
MATEIAIAGRPIGAGHPPYVIAELSGNHNGELARAMRLLEAAQAAGADAVKLQTYTADTLTIDHDGPDFRVATGLWAGRTLYDLYQEAHTPWGWHAPLLQRGRELGISVFSTPFDETAVDYLETLDAPAYKIASFELVDLALIARAARTGRPLVLSTGMANLSEIAEAIGTARDAGCRQILLLRCVSGYPTPVEESNLRTIGDLGARFHLPVGLSDHTLGIAVPIAAVALGAVAIEKHLTLDRREGGVDAAFSLEPQELAALVKSVRDAWAALGGVSYARAPSEAASVIFRRSIYVVRDVAAGETFTAQNLRVIRPGHGMAPRELPRLIGRRAARALARGTALSPEMVEGWTSGGA